MSNIDKIRQEIERMHQQAVLASYGNDTDWLRSRIGTCVDILAFIDSQPEENLSEDLEEAAKNIYKVPFGTRAEDFIVGAEWQANQLLKGSPLPEDTVLFQKGVEEGRRLEREDDNKALAEMYGYEGGTESPLVKITFTIPKEQVKNLMPIKQGDVFGIENLTNKEGRR